MSLKKRNTTGLPTSTRRNPNTRNQYRSRAQREHEVNRLVLIITGIIALVIAVILGGAFLIQNVIQPAQSVASINGASISLRDFQQRVTFDRWRDGNQLAQIYNNQYLAQQLSELNERVWTVVSTDARSSAVREARFRSDGQLFDRQAVCRRQ